jgi:hypothetical protein
MLKRILGPKREVTGDMRKFYNYTHPGLSSFDPSVLQLVASRYTDSLQALVHTVTNIQI